MNAPLTATLVAARALQVDVGPGVVTGGNVARTAIGAFLTTLVLGGLLLAFAPDYAERMMATVVDDPVSSFVYGLVCLVFVVLVTVVLAVTIIGILVAVPFALAAYLVWGVGSAVVALAIGDRLIGHEDGWLKPLLLGAGINGALTLTGIGGIVAFCIGAVGFGAVLRDWLA